MATLQPGDQAPDFSAETHTGEQISLHDYQGRIVVLFFYPMDFTSICTKEACAFRDAYEDFVQAGAVVIGVSGDTLAKHRDFAQQHRLPFVLLSDRDNQLRKSFGVPNTLGLIPQRATFVIDQQGVVRSVFNALFVANKHVTEALAMVKSLTQQPPATSPAGKEPG